MKRTGAQLTIFHLHAFGLGNTFDHDPHQDFVDLFGICSYKVVVHSDIFGRAMKVPVLSREEAELVSF